MTLLFSFMGLHPVLTFFLSFPILMFAVFTVGTVRFLLARTLRSVNILVRGWPPSHCDAAGELRQEEKG